MSAKYWISIFILHFFYAAYSQVTTPDEIYAHFDRDIYLVDEDVWFKVYFLNEKEDRSKVLYLDILDSEGTKVANQKLKIHQQVAVGDFHIPPNWKEGLYVFRFYTSWNLNFGSNYIYLKSVPIYALPAPDKKSEEASAFKVPGPQPYVRGKETTSEEFSILNIQLETDKPHYRPRDKIAISIRVTDMLGQPVSANLSLSVKNMGLLSRKSHPAAIINQKKQYRQFQPRREADPKHLFPLEEGLILQTSIRNEELRNQVKFTLPSIFMVEQRERVRSDFAYPPLNFKLPDFYGKRTLQFYEFSDYAIDSLDFCIHLPGDNISSSLKKAVPLIHTLEIDRYLQLSRERKKIHQIFGLRSIPTVPEYDAPEITSQSNKTYIIDKYVTFKNIFEFIREVIGAPLARVVEGDEGKSIRLFNQDSNRKLKVPPVYLVNNYITWDERQVLAIDWENVERIELFTHTVEMIKNFGPKGINGGFAIYTRDRKTPEGIKNASFNATFYGYYKPRNFFIPNYEDAERKANHLPDFRTVEFWNPSINCDKNGSATVSFYAGDATGLFLIHLESLGLKGNVGVGEVIYEVKLEN